MVSKILKALNDFKDYAFDNFSNVWACLLTLLVSILIVGIFGGLIFGYLCLIGWLLFLVYGALATVFAWPTFSFWFFVAATAIINLFFNRVRLIFSKEEK